MKFVYHLVEKLQMTLLPFAKTKIRGITKQMFPDIEILEGCCLGLEQRLKIPEISLLHKIKMKLQ
jgi:hypothetical protein